MAEHVELADEAPRLTGPTGSLQEVVRSGDGDQGPLLPAADGNAFVAGLEVGTPRTPS